MIEVRCWCRVDLAGGTLDIWPLGLLHPGAATVNLAIDLPVIVRLAPRTTGYGVWQEGSRIETDSVEGLLERSSTSLIGVVAQARGMPPVEVEIESGSPRGAGLGASSALTIALLVAAEELTGVRLAGPVQRARTARDLEARLMELPTGMQDHYPALLGGVLEMRHVPGGEPPRPLRVDLEGLGRCLLVVYTGESHFSAGSNWRIVRRRLDADPEITRLLSEIADIARRLPEALERGDFEQVGTLMSQEWECRRALSQGIATATVDHLLRRAAELGAWGGKVCGAGGGGCVAILSPADQRDRIARELAAAGGQLITARPTPEPMQATRL
jgi:D-glycero-alpha-D-manno-heptose-7-phosphate kinase